MLKKQNKKKQVDVMKNQISGMKFVTSFKTENSAN